MDSVARARDYRDLAIEQYGDELAEEKAERKALEDHLVSALQDADAYRELAITALDLVADLTRRVERLQKQNRRLSARADE